MKNIYSSLLNKACFLLLLALCQSTMAAVGGLTYGYVDWPSGASYYNMDQRLRIDTAPLASLNQGYFWSYQFSAGQAVGYFGLQQLPNGSRIVNAAIWDTTNGSGANGFVAEPFGGEGTGIRIHGDYPWIQGRTYRLRIWELSTNWWGFFIQDTVTGIDTYIGQIENQFDPGKLLNSSVTFTEHFSGPNTCANIAAVRSTWFPPTANGGTVLATKVTGVVSSSAAITSCGNQIVSTTNQGNNPLLNAQIVCSGGAKANLLDKGSCWRYGKYNQSCKEVCKTNGIDAVFWPTGQNLSNSQCKIVQSAFGNMGAVQNATWGNKGAGCMFYNTRGQQLFNITSPAWDVNFKNSLTKRFCGCAG